MSFIKKSYRTISEFNQTLAHNSIGAFSAQSAFFVITSFFPFMLLMVTLLQFTPFNPANIQESLSGNVLSTLTGEFLSSVIKEVSAKAAPGALLGAAGVSAVWAASRCLLSIIKGLNKVYECESKRGWFKLQILSIAYVFMLQLMFIVSLGILVFGEQLNKLLMLNRAVVNLRWVIGFALLVFSFMLIYKLLPDRKTRLSREIYGAVFSAAGWLIFSWLFSVYIDNFGNFGAVYGSLAAAVILMLWLYFCMYILFTGAQVNVLVRNIKRTR